jgi:hypothetical protein
MKIADPLARGMRSETLVEQALRRIVGGFIIAFVHNEPNSRADQKGKDFTVRTREGEVALQVKSSEYGKRHFFRHTQPHRAEIPVIVVKDEDTVETLLGRLLSLIYQACERLKRRIAFVKGKATTAAKLKEKYRERRPHRICHYRHSMAH